MWPEAEREKAEWYFKMSSAAYSAFNQRRVYEWKVNFALWAALALLTALGLKGELQAPLPAPPLALGGVCAGVLVFYVLWLAGVQSANRVDQRLASNYQKALITSIASPGRPLDIVVRPPRQWVKALFNYAPLCEIVATGGMLFVLWYVWSSASVDKDAVGRFSLDFSMSFGS